MLYVAIFVAICGPTYEVISRYQTASEFQVIGKLVDIGGRRIQLDCRGVGTPTVVFESGLDLNGSLSWSAIHDGIPKATRACAYSRAGIMWSEPRTGIPNGKAIAEDLHLALRNVGEKAPYVLVGHSMGGPYIMNYTKYFGSEVTGLVFVDASHPDQFTRFRVVPLPSERTWFLRMEKAGVALARTGITRAIIVPLLKISPLHHWRLRNQPAFASNAVLAYSPTSLDSMLKEHNALREILAEAATVRQLNDRPLFVLTGMEPMPPEVLAYLKLTPEQGKQCQENWKNLHDEEASWSTQSQREVVFDAGHYIQFDRPNLVVAAVLSVLSKVRSEAN
jgi:pimeloyl-ACP methyl ester carboxylesterase